MSNIGKLLESVSDFWKGLVALVAGASLAFTLGISVSGFMPLPEIVEANTASIEGNKTAIREVSDSVQALGSKMDLMICLQRADRLGTSALDDCGG